MGLDDSRPPPTMTAGGRGRRVEPVFNSVPTQPHPTSIGSAGSFAHSDSDAS